MTRDESPARAKNSTGAIAASVKVVSLQLEAPKHAPFGNAVAGSPIFRVAIHGIQ